MVMMGEMSLDGSDKKNGKKNDLDGIVGMK